MSDTSATTAVFYRCRHCGGSRHQGECPRIKSIEYHQNGLVKRVEYHSTGGDDE